MARTEPVHACHDGDCGRNTRFESRAQVHYNREHAPEPHREFVCLQCGADNDKLEGWNGQSCSIGRGGHTESDLARALQAFGSAFSSQHPVYCGNSKARARNVFILTATALLFSWRTTRVNTVGPRDKLQTWHGSSFQRSLQNPQEARFSLTENS